MAINHWVRALLIVAALLTAPKVLAQQPHCKDSAEHIRLREAMWASCKQDSQQVVYDACMAYLAHAKEDGDMLDVDLYIIVEYGISISEVCKTIVETVRYKLESTTGVKVRKISISVEGIRI